MGRIAERHSGQTGRRETLVRGMPQTRQSEEKKVANRLSAMPFSDETSVEPSPLCPDRALFWARIKSPLLLKTSLPRPHRCLDSSGTNLVQYSGETGNKQRKELAASGVRCQASRFGSHHDVFRSP